MARTSRSMTTHSSLLTWFTHSLIRGARVLSLRSWGAGAVCMATRTTRETDRCVHSTRCSQATAAGHAKRQSLVRSHVKAPALLALFDAANESMRPHTHQDTRAERAHAHERERTRCAPPHLHEAQSSRASRSSSPVLLVSWLCPQRCTCHTWASSATGNGHQTQGARCQQQQQQTPSTRSAGPPTHTLPWILSESVLSPLLPCSRSHDWIKSRKSGNCHARRRSRSLAFSMIAPIAAATCAATTALPACVKWRPSLKSAARSRSIG